MSLCNWARKSAEPATSQRDSRNSKGKAKSSSRLSLGSQPIPPPPPPGTRAEHLRPSTPALARSKTPSTTTNRSVPKPSADALRTPLNNPFNKQPWATVEVDRLMCAMDAQGYDYSQIIRRTKMQFPQLRYIPITVDMAHTRLAVLDHRLDLEFFKRGLEKPRKASKSTGGGSSSRAQSKVRNRSKGKAKAVQTTGESSRNVSVRGRNPSLKHKQSDSELKSRGARHGKAIAESSTNLTYSQSDTGGHVAEPLTGSANPSKSGGMKHGKLTHEHEEEDVIGTVPPMVNSTARSNGFKSRGIEHGRAIHHNRNQSTVSSTFTGTTAVISSSIDDTVHAPEGLVYTRPVTPAASEASTTVRLPPISSTAFDPASALSSVENDPQPTRAARLGRAIHASPGRSQIPVSKGKLRVTNGLNKEELSSSPDPTSSPKKSPTASTRPNGMKKDSTPAEFRRKRSTTHSVNPTKENEVLKLQENSPSLEHGEPGPSTVAPKPLSVKRSATAATKKDHVHITEPEESEIRNSDDLVGTPKVGKMPRPSTPYA